MRWAFLLLILASNALGQTLPRVQPEEAAKHLVSNMSPIYPPFAQQTRISGDVLLEIAIAPDGKTFVRRLISGHPLLVQAAITAVNNWQFQPFIVDGKPATVVTAVIVPFGNAGNQSAADQTQVIFQYYFWTTESFTQAALARGDFLGAEQQLKKAHDLLVPVASDPRNNPERLQWILDSGDLSKAQQKYDEAEQSYHKGLELLQKRDKEAAEVAAVLARLGALYAEEKRYDLARDHFSHSIVIYQKNLKKIGSGNPGARQFYGAAIANESWMLSEVERHLNNHPEAINQCRTVLEFQDFLNTANRDSIVSGCQKTIAESH